MNFVDFTKVLLYILYVNEWDCIQLYISYPVFTEVETGGS